MSYVTHNGDHFTHTSIERAFDSHKEAKLIKDWHRDKRSVGRNEGNRRNPLYTVLLAAGRTELYLANIWEAHAFVSGLASARTVLERQLAEVTRLPVNKAFSDGHEHMLYPVERAPQLGHCQDPRHQAEVAVPALYRCRLADGRWHYLCVVCAEPNIREHHGIVLGNGTVLG